MSWKRTLRRATDRGAKYSGLLWACELAMRSKITILMYHRVLEDEDCADYPFPSLIMPRSLFEAQVDWLSKHAHVLPVSDGLSQASVGYSGSQPLVCLTFDDGYIDNFEIAAPVLEARGIRGTFFIAAGAVEARQPLWYDLAAATWSLLGDRRIRQTVSQSTGIQVPDFATREAWIEWLKSLPDNHRISIVAVLRHEADDSALCCELMTASQVRQLAERGHEVGSHTLRHPILPSMPEDACRQEIEGARAAPSEMDEATSHGILLPEWRLQFGSHSTQSMTRATVMPVRRGQVATMFRADRFRLRRIDMTCDRIVATDGRFDALAFRAELCLLREHLRGWAKLRGEQSG